MTPLSSAHTWLSKRRWGALWRWLLLNQRSCSREKQASLSEHARIWRKHSREKCVIGILQGGWCLCQWLTNWTDISWKLQYDWMHVCYNGFPGDHAACVCLRTTSCCNAFSIAWTISTFAQGNAWKVSWSSSECLLWSAVTNERFWFVRLVIIFVVLEGNKQSRTHSTSWTCEI